MPANPLRPVVRVEIEGETYLLENNANAWVAFEEATGKSFCGLLARVMRLLPTRDRVGDIDPQEAALTALEHIHVKDLRALIWAAMHEHQPSLSIEDVGRRLTPKTAVPFLVGVLTAESSAAPTAAESAQLAKVNGQAAAVERTADPTTEEPPRILVEPPGA